MGGTFDPIHHGHLVCASEVASIFDLDEVVFIPTGMPWQKHEDDVSPAEHRYLMTVIATSSNPVFTVSRLEIDRDGPTYTIDTLRRLREERGDVDLFFITGADALAQILTWRDPDGDAQPRALRRRDPPRLRAGGAGPAGGRGEPGRDPRAGDLVERLRRRVREGKPIWYLVPDSVVRYIDKARLYAEAVAR